MTTATINNLREYRENVLNRQSPDTSVYVCVGPGCLAKGSGEIFMALKERIENDSQLRDSVSIKSTGCHGYCEGGPLITIENRKTDSSVFYTKVKDKHLDEIVDKTLKNNEVIEKLLYKNPDTKERVSDFRKIVFYAKQQKLVTRNIGTVDPASIDDYIQREGYQALEKIFAENIDRGAIIDTIAESGLRGRGGGGFSTGRKWRSCVQNDSDMYYIICNGDEGDPGAFMDRAIMEGDPHSVIEGMIIGGYALGSKRGYIYVREEYPLAVQYLQKAIEEAQKLNLLGDNILGSDFSFDLRISRGAGAFVCGESSALMLSVAGNVGEPRSKYIHSTEKGLWDKPTVLNNVETFSCVPLIVNNGAEWFRKVGVKNNSGTKVFSLVGHVNNTGLVEVPMGATLREIIFDIGGGITDKRPFKAVQTGGPSGGCLPESKLDCSVDFDTLTKEGSMMGSGGMIVMSDFACMVDVSRYFLQFLQEESCGKCVPCREGVSQMYSIVNDICEGRGRMGDIEILENLSSIIKASSLCALGKSAPNPLDSTLKYFRDEYIEHIKDKKCRAGVCRELCDYEINDKCTGCMLCIKACPVEAITGEKKQLHVIDKEKCVKCGECFKVCKDDAVSF